MRDSRAKLGRSSSVTTCTPPRRTIFGAFVWNDVRTALDCPAVDAWRSALRTKDKKDDPPRPEPNNDCSADIGDSSIFGATIADPT